MMVLRGGGVFIYVCACLAVVCADGEDKIRMGKDFSTDIL